MMDLGPHSAFILASYAISLVVVLGAIGWIIVDYRRQKQILADLEARGVTRRSAGTESAGKDVKAREVKA